MKFVGPLDELDTSLGREPHPVQLVAKYSSLINYFHVHLRYYGSIAATTTTILDSSEAYISINCYYYLLAEVPGVARGIKIK